jgi:diguanylate cyclase (GGDEF)-like protein
MGAQAVIIMSPFYQTAWFYALCSIAGVIILASCYRSLIRRTKMRKEQIVRVLEERIESLELRTHWLDQANQDLQRLSYLDALTGIANRRHFEESLDLEWRRACRIGAALSLIMIDADFFKDFNDAYGHQRGDDCLKLLASSFRNALNRPGDLIARYGGEEFMMILPGINAQGAAEMAEATRARVEAMEIMHEGSRADKVMTVSLGVVTGYPSAGFSPGELVAAADEALYRAKEEGRNRVAISAEVMKSSSRDQVSPPSHTWL